MTPEEQQLLGKLVSEGIDAFSNKLILFIGAASGLIMWYYNRVDKKEKEEEKKLRDILNGYNKDILSSLKNLELSNNSLVLINQEQSEFNKKISEIVKIIQEDIEYTDDFYIQKSNHTDIHIEDTNTTKKAVIEIKDVLLKKGFELKEEINPQPIPKFKDKFIGFDKRDPSVNSQVA